MCLESHVLDDLIPTTPAKKGISRPRFGRPPKSASRPKSSTGPETQKFVRIRALSARLPGSAWRATFLQLSGSSVRSAIFGPSKDAVITKYVPSPAENRHHNEGTGTNRRSLMRRAGFCGPGGPGSRVSFARIRALLGRLRPKAAKTLGRREHKYWATSLRTSDSSFRPPPPGLMRISYKAGSPLVPRARPLCPAGRALCGERGRLSCPIP